MTEKAERFNDFVRLMDSYEDAFREQTKQGEEITDECDDAYNQVISFVRKLIFEDK